MPAAPPGAGFPKFAAAPRSIFFWDSAGLAEAVEVGCLETGELTVFERMFMLRLEGLASLATSAGLARSLYR